MENKNFFNKLKNEYLGNIYATFCGVFIVIITFSIILFLASKGVKSFINNGVSVKEFVFSGHWSPEGDIPSFGSAKFILGSTLVSLGAILISTPISISLALFITYISPNIGKKILRPAIELFVGIPSVLYGWLGVTLLVPLIKNIFGGIGFSLFAGIIVLSIMILPTITSLTLDTLKNIPKEYMEASYGMGATRSQTIFKVLLPAGKTGILTGIVLGLARAFGEALAVQMVIGNTLKYPDSLLKPATTLTSVLTMDMANTLNGTPWNDALWSLALLLLLISFLFILIIKFIGKKGEK
ncbi:phosphate ABC transporter permease subunit PstC [Hathewaya limosa]|uniref:Phosphate transport system permease protein n=1 Tax=Hathewaya limosa TaxID=1536 RepID=A0ABU0JSB3_HATLI|nr:phosphate ABC transporter permease subunit PstC [Hathewaya limosa]AWZ48738.1 phosphate ABC transporter permease subunit PstC [Clostridiaceae bacterium 14S0207]MDQ0478974.1 phosphate transport system permease protein [Hathewaya limosa]